jgi:beta-lactamase class A
MYSYTYRVQQKRRTRKKIIIGRVVAILILAALIFTLSKILLGGIKKQQQIASPEVIPTLTPKPSPTSSPEVLSVNNSSLSTAVSSALEGTTGTYAVYIKNLNNNETFFLNEHKKFETGSLYKLWTMAVVYEQIEKGNLTKDQKLSQDIATLNQKFGIAPEDAELTTGAISQTVELALNQMITISHNYSALLLTEKIKLSSVANFLKDNGFKESAVGTNNEAPTSTVYDIALFLEKLYRLELANEENTKEMIELLKKQQKNNKLPKYLPGVQIAHKTGEIGTFSHDAGVVYTPKGGYLIIVMSDSGVPAAAEDRIAQISKGVYEYFTKE